MDPTSMARHAGHTRGVEEQRKSRERVKKEQEESCEKDEVVE